VASPEDAIAELQPIPEGVFAQWFPDGSEWPRYVVGSPVSVRRKLSAMAEALGIDEIMVVTIVYDHAARVRSYELLAEAFELRGAQIGAAERSV
jgi:alkanesulfonate monooxygenase SsuD/methylene tetrahydromethanopterin reductase-like flavin-dependent oxidoreductase (luciferase family)